MYNAKKKSAGLFVLMIMLSIIILLCNFLEKNVNANKHIEKEIIQSNTVIENNNEKAIYFIYYPNTKLSYEYDGNKLCFEFPIEIMLKERNQTNHGWDIKYLCTNDLDIIFDLYIEEKHIGAMGWKYYQVSSCPYNLLDVYRNIALPNDYHFDIETDTLLNDKYSLVSDNGIISKIVTRVYYHSDVADGVGYKRETHYNDGILVHNTENMLYIAMEFENDYFNEEQLIDIAQDVNISIS